MPIRDAPYHARRTTRLGALTERRTGNLCALELPAVAAMMFAWKRRRVFMEGPGHREALLFAVIGLYVLVAIATTLAEASGLWRQCECEPDCWCKRPGVHRRRELGHHKQIQFAPTPDLIRDGATRMAQEADRRHLSHGIIMLHRHRRRGPAQSGSSLVSLDRCSSGPRPNIRSPATPALYGPIPSDS
jgi:hypothetical protein